MPDDIRPEDLEWKEFFRKTKPPPAQDDGVINLNEKPTEAQERHACKMSRSIFGTKCDHDPICGP